MIEEKEHSLGSYSPSRMIMKSFVFHEKSGAIFVSTIERDYETYEGVTRGLETMVWKWGEQTRERGEHIGHIGHMGGLVDHQRICQCWISEGEMLDENNEKHERFFK